MQNKYCTCASSKKLLTAGESLVAANAEAARTNIHTWERKSFVSFKENNALQFWGDYEVNKQLKGQAKQIQTLQSTINKL